MPGPPARLPRHGRGRSPRATAGRPDRAAPRSPPPRCDRAPARPDCLRRPRPCGVRPRDRTRGAPQLVVRHVRRRPLRSTGGSDCRCVRCACRREAVGRGLEGGGHHTRPARRQSIHHPRHPVLLDHDDRRARAASGEDRRGTRVPTDADDHVARPHQWADGAGGGERQPERLRGVHGQPGLGRRDAHGHEREPGRRHGVASWPAEDPTNRTSCPAARSRSATATAGNTCPAVPPPA